MLKFDRSNVVNEVQLAKICEKLVIDEVLKFDKSKDSKDSHKVNILFIYKTLDVSKFLLIVIFFKFLQS